jgi:tRNA dimethylallyltransferase
VRALRRAGLEANPSAAGAIGYRETLAALHAEEGHGARLDETRLAEEITLNTWGLVRRQKTWFRGRLPAEGDRVRWLEANAVTAATLFPAP